MELKESILQKIKSSYDEQNKDYKVSKVLLTKLLINKKLSKEEISFLLGKSRDVLLIIMNIILYPTFPVSFTILKKLVNKFMKISLSPKYRSNDLPFSSTVLTDYIELREFDSALDESELKWHTDGENRIIIPINSKGWYIQFDNETPKELIEGNSYLIEKDKFHRVINNGNDNLVLYLIKN